MPGNKSKLQQGLANNTTNPAIQRGAGVRLSTDVNSIAESQDSENASSHNRISASSQKRGKKKVQDEHTRINRGYTLREDIVAEYKVLAARSGRPMYELMERALAAYLREQGIEIAK